MVSPEHSNIQISKQYMKYTMKYWLASFGVNMKMKDCLIENIILENSFKVMNTLN